MRETEGKGNVKRSTSDKVWQDSITSHFPPGELHVFDENLNYVYSAAGPLKKRKADEAPQTGGSILDFVDKEMAGIFGDHLHRALRGETFSFESSYKGNRYLSHFVPMFDREKEKSYVLLHSTEISELKKIGLKSAVTAAGTTGGDSFWEGEEKFRLISENVPDLIAVLDVKGRHVYLNPSYKNIISNPDALLGKDVLEIVHPDDRAKVGNVLREGLEAGLDRRIEFRLMAPDGSVRFVEARGKAVRDDSGKLTNAVIVSRDITEKKTLEEQYFRNQRIESLGTLAGGISHDLSNLLTPIILGVEALKRIENDEKAIAILNSISSSLSRGRDIVRQVLTFARGVEGGTMLIQPRHIIKEVVTLMRETFPKSIAIVENIPKMLWLINGDAIRISQMVTNLGVNARDAMPEGGILYLSAENFELDEQFAAMKPGAKPGPYVLLTVQDTGVGMPREVKERIFEPFFTTKDAGRGTGLGLSIVHSIVKGHGGFITVESELGKSTTFKVYLPAIETAESEKPGRTDLKMLSGHGELLMVVDDEVSVCQITRQTLEAFGYRVLTATDGTEAVALFAEKKDEVALVVMDIAMPIMDGPRTIRALRRLRPDVRVVASSGIISEDLLNLEGAAAVSAFLPKPYTADKLLQTIYSVIHTGLLDSDGGEKERSQL
jgi:PAS domain S-box-containing protein